jgi:catechol-2,3-dioxygenase
MEAMIASLVSRFERGALSRRELIQGLAMLAAASGTASTAQAQDAATKGARIDHVSIQVSDLPRSSAFYQKMFGLTVVSEDKPNEIVRSSSGMPTYMLMHAWNAMLSYVGGRKNDEHPTSRHYSGFIAIQQTANTERKCRERFGDGMTVRAANANVRSCAS